MAIPERQLKTWSNQGATATAKATHEAIRHALEAYEDWPKETGYGTYLQGSYRNSTNIRGDSDVDLVVQLNSTFRSNSAKLSRAESDLYSGSYTDATYGWTDFRADVLAALRARFGVQAITEGKKSVKVHGASGRLPADVVVCMQYRKYSRFRGKSESYVEGMTFYVPPEDRWVVNYPKHHYEYGAKKNADGATNGWFKPTVRVFKNMRNDLIDKGSIGPATARSYFIECMVYNVPDHVFGDTYQDTVGSSIAWLWNGVDLRSLNCQHGQTHLIGTEPEQWDEEKAVEFIGELSDLWHNWK